jgi:PAS domain S-box-containing protein
LAASDPQKSERRTVATVLVTSGLVFAVDVAIPLGVADCIPHIVPVLLSLNSRRRGVTIAAAALTSALTLLGFWFSPPGGVLWQVLANRGLALFAIWTTALLCLHQKRSDAAREHLDAQLAAERAMAEAVARSEARHRAVMDSVLDAVIVTDANGRVQSANRAVGPMLGWSPDELVGQRVNALWLETAGSDAPILGRLRQVQVRRRDGSGFPAEIVTLPVEGLDGEPLFVGALRDISERRALEGRLLQARKLEAIGQLAAGIAHEINTPTQYVTDNLRFVGESAGALLALIAAWEPVVAAARDAGIDPVLLEKAEVARTQAEVDLLSQDIPLATAQGLEGLARIAEIVRAMNHFSNAGSKERAAVDLNRAIESTATVAGSHWKPVAELELALDPALPPVPCVMGELNQVFLNLLVNAAQAITERLGPVPEQLGRIRFSTRCDGDAAEIRVADNGAGIPEAIRDRIFDPFFTTKPVGKGTGHGLAIAHAVVVEQHGGSIRCESEVGVGTTFVIRLPLAFREAGAVS